MADVFLMPDISHWQGHHTREDMERAGTRVDAIMLKATEGTSFVDPEFVSNAEAVNTAGALGPLAGWGAYHFVRPGHPHAQAEHFYGVATSIPGCGFLCIDWEAGARKTALRLADRLLDLALGLSVGDYIGAHARANGGQLPEMAFHMVPHYGPSDGPAFPTDPLSAWQYTNGVINGTNWPDTIPGIGPCDVSAVFRPDDFGFGDDMALTPQDLEDIKKAVWSELIGPPDSLQSARERLRQADYNAALLVTRVAKLKEALGDLPAAVVAALPPPTGGGLTEEQVENACRAAVKGVLGALDDPVVPA